MPAQEPPSDAAIDHALRVLKAARALPLDDPRYIRLERGVAHLVKTGKKRRKKARDRATKAHDRAVLRSTGLGVERFGTAPSAARQTKRSRPCYVCHKPYNTPHTYFHAMCHPCGEESLAARANAADLAGRRALVTGGRIKIGHATALSLLRMGAEVHVTSRFPKDALARFAAHADYATWHDRLHLYGLDFRMVPTVLAQIEAWRAGPAFDILINNAAQTVWHPPAYYQALHARERAPLALEGQPAASLTRAPVETKEQAMLALGTPHALFPVGETDIQGNPLDLRRTNSWVQELQDIAPLEMVEVQVINSMVPFLLCSRLEANFRRSRHKDRYMVNVTAVEGAFDRENKQTRHPHTNMAKAAMNMITRTSAGPYATRGIYMTSVDPGWMSHEGPAAQVKRAYDAGFHPPLTAADSAARVLDPILRGIGGKPVHGVLLKDFRVSPW